MTDKYCDHCGNKILNDLLVNRCDNCWNKYGDEMIDGELSCDNCGRMFNPNLEPYDTDGCGKYICHQCPKRKGWKI